MGKQDNAKTKPPISIIPYESLANISLAMAYGAEKYGRGDYRNQDTLCWTLYADACYRHLGEWLEGTDRDRESGIHHVSHAAASLVILLFLISQGRGHDDREV